MGLGFLLLLMLPLSGFSGLALLLTPSCLSRLVLLLFVLVWAFLGMRLWAARLFVMLVMIRVCIAHPPRKVILVLTRWMLLLLQCILMLVLPVMMPALLARSLALLACSLRLHIYRPLPPNFLC